MTAITEPMRLFEITWADGSKTQVSGTSFAAHGLSWKIYRRRPTGYNVLTLAADYELVLMIREVEEAPTSLPVVSTVEELLTLPNRTLLLEREDNHRTPDVWRLVRSPVRAVMVFCGCGGATWIRHVGWFTGDTPTPDFPKPK